jgi:hypothetical protein
MIVRYCLEPAAGRPNPFECGPSIHVEGRLHDDVRPAKARRWARSIRAAKWELGAASDRRGSSGSTGLASWCSRLRESVRRRTRPTSEHPVSFRGAGRWPAAIYRQGRLGRAITIRGPAIVEEEDSTPLVPPDATTSKSGQSILVLDRPADAPATPVAEVCRGAVAEARGIAVADQHHRPLVLRADDPA